jgi:hypothetical protein
VHQQPTWRGEVAHDSLPCLPWLRLWRIVPHNSSPDFWKHVNERWQSISSASCCVKCLIMLVEAMYFLGRVSKPRHLRNHLPQESNNSNTFRGSFDRSPCSTSKDGRSRSIAQSTGTEYKEPQKAHFVIMPYTQYRCVISQYCIEALAGHPNSPHLSIHLHAQKLLFTSHMPFHASSTPQFFYNTR